MRSAWRGNGLVVALCTTFLRGTGERESAASPPPRPAWGSSRTGSGSRWSTRRPWGAAKSTAWRAYLPRGRNLDDLRETLVSNLRFAAARLGEAGIRLLVEPINTRDIPGFYLNYSQQALSIIEEVGSDNLWLQYDVYHMQIMEGDLIPTMRANLGSIGHIQIADTPGRHEPGTGEINYPNVFSAIDDMGYEGWIGCEYIPLTTTEEGLGWADKYLRRRS